MTNLFHDEEKQVAGEFDLRFRAETELIQRFFVKIEELLESSGFRNDEYPDYSIALHICHGLMALNNSLALLRNGYMGDCEAVRKRAIEFFLRAVYFNEFPEEEAKWRKGKQISHRREMARKLDERHRDRKVFPTSSETFFENLVYEAMYGIVNEWAHGDFKTMYRETAIDDGTQYYTADFMLGPRFDEAFAKKMLQKLVVSCTLHVSFMADKVNLPEERYKNLMMEAGDYIKHSLQR
jgi:hypothetical protein